MTPGSSTSEFKLARAAFIAGAILEAAATCLHTLQDGGISAPWFAGGLAAIGVLLQITTFLGYTKSRTLVKAEALRSLPDSVEYTAVTPK